jgi:hypothetical protein
MPFVILPTNSASGGYDITNSLRFNPSSSDSLARTFSSTGNRQKWTLSLWLKRSGLSAETYIIQSLLGGGDYTAVFFNSSNNLIIDDYISTRQFRLITTQVFRDVSAWYHIIIAIDTTQATSSNRVKMYVNGSQVTAFSTETYPAQNTNGFFNQNRAHNIGINTFDNSSYFGGYISDFYFIDGQQLTPSSFGETDEDTGIWKPKAYTGTYGTNGFYLQFKNSASLGTDSSGNGNAFTVNNLTSVDQSTDTPTNNFCTLNPLNTYPSTKPVLSEGNLQVVTVNADPGYWGASSTLGVSSGKWYVEFKPTNSTSGSPYLLGVSYNPAEMARNGATGASQYTSADWGYYGGSGDIYNNGGNTAYGNTYTTNDIIGVALDLDNNKLYFSKNGTFQNSGVPTSGATGTGAISITANQTYFFFISDLGGGVCTYQANFGNPPYSANSYTDGAGYGNFSYSVPSGYYSLNTRNLAQFG